VRHEQSVVEAAQLPSRHSFAEALRLDPLVPEHQESACRLELERRWLAAPALRDTRSN
jgi:hypothetical protein